MDLRPVQITVFADSERDGVVKSDVVVYPGLNPMELKAVLEQQFQMPDPIALVDCRDESVISLSIVCQSPEILDADEYRVLFEMKRYQAVESPTRTSQQLVQQGYHAEPESDDDDEEAIWLLQAHLLMAITFFEDKNSLTSEQAEILRKLTSEADERVMGAMHLFNEDKDWNELKDTLTTLSSIALRELQEQQYVQDDEEDSDDIDYDEESLDYDEDDDDQHRNQMLQTVMWFYQAGLLKQSDTLIIKRLVDIENSLVLAAFEVYEERGDEGDFVDTLCRISSFYSLDKVLRGLLGQGYITRQEADILTGMFCQSNSNVTLAWKLYTQHRNQRVFSDQLLTILICHDKAVFVKRMEARNIFDPVETSIILALLKKNDPALFAIFDLLLNEGDLTDTIDSIKRLCLIRSGKKGGADDVIANMPSTLGTEATETLELVHALALDNAISEVQYLILNNLIVKQDDRLMSAYTVYVETHDLDDFIDTLKRVSLLAAPELDAVRNSSSKRLTAPQSNMNVDTDPVASEMDEDKNMLDTMFHLIYTGRLMPNEATCLGSLVTTRDPRLLAAFDVYALEKDLDDLADTLIRISYQELKDDEFSEVAEDDEYDDGNETGDTDEVFDETRDLSLDSNETITDDDYDWISEEGESNEDDDSDDVEEIDDPICINLEGSVDSLIKRASNVVGKENIVLNSALELYQMDGDETELRDTLQRLLAAQN